MADPYPFSRTENFGVKLQDRQTLALNMATEVPLVIESRKLLEKLQQNKLGGIDPFGSIGRFIVILVERPTI